jgi:hypothetical protein
MRALQIPDALRWIAITLITVVGLIHLIEAPEYFQTTAYLGVLFLANAGGAAIAAWGISRQAVWGWGLGALVAAGAFVAYFISRSLGLPGFVHSPWFESIDILSLIVEAAFVAVAIIAFTAPRIRYQADDQSDTQRPPSSREASR